MVAVAKRTIVSALDIGTTKVCCLIGEVGPDGRVEVVGKGVHSSKGVKKGIVVDIGETVLAIQKAVQEAERSAGFKLHTVFVGVTGEHISSLNSHGVITLAHEAKEIMEEDVRRSVEAAKVVSLPAEREVLHVIPRGFTLDGQDGIRNPVGMLGMRLEADTHIITGMTTFLHNLTKCVESAGLEIEENGLVLAPLASSLSVLNEAEKTMGILLLDIGGGTTDLAVFHNRAIFHTAVLPIGGHHITHDLAYAFKLSPEEAERVKLEFGSAISSPLSDEDKMEVTTLSGAKEMLSRKSISEKIVPRVEEIFALVKMELDRVAKDFALSGITLTGGTSLLPGISEVAGSIFKLPVRVAYPAPANASFGEELRKPEYASSLGLLVYGAKSVQNRKHYRKQESFLTRMFRSLFRELF
jgi:cell division protein FtsA